LKLRCAPPRTAPGCQRAEKRFDPLLDEKRQGRIALALSGSSVVTGLCIIGWIILALL